MVLNSCATNRKTVTPDVNFDLFPAFPEPFIDGELIYFITASGAFDKIIDEEGNTEVVLLNGESNYIVIPEWYWMYIEDFYTDYLYAVKTLRLHFEGDP